MPRPGAGGAAGRPLGVARRAGADAAAVPLARPAAAGGHRRLARRLARTARTPAADVAAARAEGKSASSSARRGTSLPFLGASGLRSRISRTTPITTVSTVAMAIIGKLPISGGPMAMALDGRPPPGAAGEQRQHHTGHGHGHHQRRLHHRAEQAPPPHRADRDDGPGDVADREDHREAALARLVDEGAYDGQAEADQDRRPPGQPAPRTDDRTLVPRHGDVVGIWIALAIANRGHRQHRIPCCEDLASTADDVGVPPPGGVTRVGPAGCCCGVVQSFGCAPGLSPS